ncbi:MAG: hypothetical protein KDB27_06710, partial [Planctomycetales bacterium]|nr:hypothetical protein [Planctomycetales bacterium]
MNSNLELVCQLVKSSKNETQTTAKIAAASSQIDGVTTNDINEVLSFLNECSMVSNTQKHAAQQVLSVVCGKLNPDQLSDSDTLQSRLVSDLYHRFSETDVACSYLLTILAVEQSLESVTELAELLANSPPRMSHLVVPCIGILMKRPGKFAKKIFPKALDGLQFRSVAGPVLDFANFLYRNEVTE